MFCVYGNGNEGPVELSLSWKVLLSQLCPGQPNRWIMAGPSTVFHWNTRLLSAAEFEPLSHCVIVVNIWLPLLFCDEYDTCYIELENFYYYPMNYSLWLIVHGLDVIRCCITFLVLGILEKNPRMIIQRIREKLLLFLIWR